MKNRTNKNFLTTLLSLVAVVLMLSAAAIVRDGRIFGFDLRNGGATELGRQGGQAYSTAVTANNDTLTVMPDGAIVVYTRLLAKDVQGYGGQVPLRIHIDKGGVVDSIEAEPNAESPDFFNHASSLFGKWQGKTVDEAMAEEVDAVTGATFSSHAIIANVQRGLAYAKRHAELYNASEADFFAPDAAGSPLGAVGSADGLGAFASAMGWSLGSFVALLVAMLGAIVPLFVNNRRWHYVQLALNVVVLGLWTGTFLSYTLLMRFFSGGINIATFGTIAAPFVMVWVAMLYPLIGRPGHYCANMCPFGSAQELAGKLTRRKPRLSPRLNRALNVFRNVLWGVLMVLMLTATWTAWMDYELFTAFLYNSASVWVIVLAVLFLVLSVWVPRPYCRFVCPTGSLFRS